MKNCEKIFFKKNVIFLKNPYFWHSREKSFVFIQKELHTAISIFDLHNILLDKNKNSVEKNAFNNILKMIAFLLNSKNFWVKMIKFININETKYFTTSPSWNLIQRLVAIKKWIELWFFLKLLTRKCRVLYSFSILDTKAAHSKDDLIFAEVGAFPNACSSFAANPVCFFISSRCSRVFSRVSITPNRTKSRGWKRWVVCGGKLSINTLWC